VSHFYSEKPGVMDNVPKLHDSTSDAFTGIEVSDLFFKGPGVTDKISKEIDYRTEDTLQTTPESFSGFEVSDFFTKGELNESGNEDSAPRTVGVSF
jgi:hypothetical protein